MDTQREITGEQVLRIATQLYRMRKSAKFLYGAKYSEKVEEYKPYVLAHMKKHKWCKGEIAAATEMAHLLLKEENSAGAIMLLFAAALEIIEPSNN